MGLVTPTTEHGYCSFALTGQVDHAAGASVGHILNPEGVAIIITKCIVYTAANSTGAANLAIGYAATATLAHDTHELFDAAALAAAVGTAIVGHATGDPADSLAVVPATNYIVACTSADSSGFTGRAYIEYVRVG